MRRIVKSKKGSIIDPIIFIVIAFVIVMFFGLWVYGFDQITTNLVGITDPTGKVNISGAAEDSFGQINLPQAKGLRTLAYMLMFSMMLSILLTNFLEKMHPAFFVVYLFVVIGAIIAAVYISNQYESLMMDAILGATLMEFKGASFIMLYLPIWITVIGFFGAIFLFAGIMRNRELGGGI